VTTEGNASQDIIMTPAEAAAFLRICIPTLRDAVRRKTIPAIYVGKRWRVSKAALLRYLEGTAVQEPQRIAMRRWGQRPR
jgi:excisionase family DNA binding protein